MRGSAHTNKSKLSTVNKLGHGQLQIRLYTIRGIFVPQLCLYETVAFVRPKGKSLGPTSKWLLRDGNCHLQGTYNTSSAHFKVASAVVGLSWSRIVPFGFRRIYIAPIAIMRFSSSFMSCWILNFRELTWVLILIPLGVRSRDDCKCSPVAEAFQVTSVLDWGKLVAMSTAPPSVDAFWQASLAGWGWAEWLQRQPQQIARRKDPNVKQKPGRFPITVSRSNRIPAHSDLFFSLFYTSAPLMIFTLICLLSSLL